jgi:hypothetical protein
VSVTLSLLTLLIGGYAHAATSPDLGFADPFAILGSTYTNTAPGTTINGDLGYTTGPAVPPTVNGTTYVADGTYAQAGIDQGAALIDLNNQPCTFNFAPGAVDLAANLDFPTATYSPGVYCATGAMSVGGGGITLDGAGTYIFRTDAALDTVAGSAVTLQSGATACEVWWTATGATTLGANSTFYGTVIDAAGITVGSTVTWTGRALAFGGTVTTDVDTITAPDCGAAAASLTVTKTVVNDDDGTLAVSDFPLFVNGQSVNSGVATTTLAPGAYTVTETSDAGYGASAWGGDCAADGTITLVDGETATCTITNDDADSTSSNNGSRSSRRRQPEPTETASSTTGALTETTAAAAASSTNSTDTDTTNPIAFTADATTNGIPGLPNAGIGPSNTVPLTAALFGVAASLLVLFALRRRSVTANAV